MTRYYNQQILAVLFFLLLGITGSMAQVKKPHLQERKTNADSLARLVVQEAAQIKQLVRAIDSTKDSLKKFRNLPASRKEDAEKISQLKQQIDEDESEISFFKAETWAQQIGLAALLVLCIILVLRVRKVSKKGVRQKQQFEDLRRDYNLNAMQKISIVSQDKGGDHFKNETRVIDITEMPKNFIKVETMQSAGPRKDAGAKDTELGEDIVGTLSLPGQAFFWLLDGTSDSAIITSSQANGDTGEPFLFSSRLLAQHIGYYIQKHIAGCIDRKMTLSVLLVKARDHVLSEWTRRINSKEETQEKKEQILRLMEQGFKILCSTTVIMGRLLANGQLYAIRTGDSKIFPFIAEGGGGRLVLAKRFKFVKDPAEENDRITFRLEYNKETQQFFIRYNDHRWSEEIAEGVRSVFAFSDGIGKVVEAQLSSDNPGIIEVIKQNISRIPQKTYDDKTLIILERVNQG